MSKEEVLELLDELVARLEGPAARVYELALWSNVRTAIVVLALSSMGIGVALFSLRKTIAAFRAKSGGYGWSDAQISWFWATIFIAFVSLPAFIVGLLSLVNVQWYTLRQLVPGL